MVAFTRAYTYAQRSGPFIGAHGSSLDSSVGSSASLEGGIQRPVPRLGQEPGAEPSYVASA